MSIVKRRRSVGSSLGSYAGGAVGAYMGGPVGKYVASRIGGYVGNKIAGAMSGKRQKTAEKKVASYALKNETSMTTRVAVCKKKGNLSKGNRKKKVKVSKSLRKKISKVIEQKKLHGSWTQLSYGTLDATQIYQKVSVLLQQPTLQDFSNVWNFTPEDFLHIASVLFNGKIDSQTNRSILNNSNLGMTNFGEGEPFFHQTYGCNAKFHVINSSVSYHMKNNSQSTLRIRAYTCSVKKPGIDASVTYQPDGTANTGQLLNVNPIQVWNTSLATQTGFNVTGATTQLVGMRPENDPKWKQTFNYEVCDILLDPGQTNTFTVAGPSDQELDFQKFFHNNQFMPVQKFSRATFFIVYHDLTSGKEGASDVAGRFKAGNQGRCCIEKKMYCKISIPESTGLKVENLGTAVANLELNLRRTVFGYKQYATALPESGASRVDEEQPASVI